MIEYLTIPRHPLGLGVWRVFGSLARKWCCMEGGGYCGFLTRTSLGNLCEKFVFADVSATFFAVARFPNSELRSRKPLVTFFEKLNITVEADRFNSLFYVSKIHAFYVIR